MSPNKTFLTVNGRISSLIQKLAHSIIFTYFFLPSLPMTRTYCILLALLFITICPSQSQDRPIDQWIRDIAQAKDTARFQLQYQVGSYYQEHEIFDSALIYLRSAKKTVEQTNDHRGLAQVCNSLGLLQRNYSNTDEAMKLLAQSLAVSENSGFQDLQAYTLFNMALVFGDQGDQNSALQYNRRSLHLLSILKDTLRMIKAYTYFGDVYGTLNQPDSALSYLNRGLALCNQLKSVPMQALSQVRMNLLFNLAGVHISSGRPSEALAILEPLYDQVKNMKLIVAQRYLLSSLANANKDLEAYEKAIAYTNELESLLIQDSIPELYRILYETRSEIHSATGNYKEAFRNLELASQLKDQIFSETKQKTVAEIRNRYESEKKDEAIAKLSQEKKAQNIILILSGIITVIALSFLFLMHRSKTLQRRLFEQKEKSIAQDKFIEQTLMQKKMIELEQMALQSQMNPHFIFNCLNSIQEFVIDKDVINANKYLSSFAFLIRQTLEASSKQKISLEEEIQYLENYLELEQMRYKHQFSYSILVQHDISPSDVFIPAILIQPFVENSIRHGILNKSGEGKLQISFTSEGADGILCTVQDNGIGRESAMKIKKTSHPGFPSRGMKLVQERIELLNKQDQMLISLNFQDLTDESGEPTGTRVNLSFKTKEPVLS